MPDQKYKIPNRILESIWDKPLALQLYFYFYQHANLPIHYWAVKDFCERHFKTISERKIENAITSLLSCNVIKHVASHTSNKLEHFGGSFMMEVDEPGQ